MKKFLTALILFSMVGFAHGAVSISTTTRTDALTALLPDLNAGHIDVYSGASPGVENAVTGDHLISWTLNATNTCSNAVITLGTVNSQNALASGTAGYFRITNSSDIAIADGDVGMSNASLIVTTTNVQAGMPCTLNGTITSSPPTVNLQIDVFTAP